MRLKQTAATSLAIVTLAVAGLFTAGSPAHAAAPAYLFTVQAASGSTAPSQTANGEDERFTLTLRGVDPVTKFADRPFRAASVMTPGALVSNWNSWFASSAPNAVLTFANGTGRAPQSIVVTLSSPRYDNAGRTLTFTATRTYRTQDPGQKGKDWKRPVTPRTFTSASLFIDDAGSSVTDSLTAQLQQAMQQFVFAPNDANTWAAVQASLTGVLTNAWQKGTLSGASASQAFTVNCQTFTTQQILNGFLNCSVTMHLADGTTFSTTLSQQQAN